MCDISFEKGVPTIRKQWSMLSRKTPFDWLKFGWMNTKTTTIKDSTMIWQNMGQYREGKTWDSIEKLVKGKFRNTNFL